MKLHTLAPNGHYSRPGDCDIMSQYGNQLTVFLLISVVGERGDHISLTTHYDKTTTKIFVMSHHPDPIPKQ